MLNHLVSALCTLLFFCVSTEIALFGFRLVDGLPLASAPRDLLKGSLGCALLMICLSFVGSELGIT
jgi:hypothetical protein